MTIEYSRVLLSELSMPVDLHDGKSIEKKLEQLNNIRNI